MKKANDKYTILYARLSKEDKNIGESDSIQNQRLILEKYAKDNGFLNTKFMFDDGVSGTNFNRPAWNEVIELVENDEVSMIIIKDLSRLGRNYLEMGNLTEIIFPHYNVRFISVNDNLDSLKGIDDFTPVKNVMNEIYAKECSRKIKASVKAKAQTGARIGALPPYGYKKDPLNPKRKIVPDENTAGVVKKIFSLSAAGVSPTEVARRLTEEKILTPAGYYYETYGVALSKYDPDRIYIWKHNIITRILEQEAYAGHTVSLKTTVKSFRDKTRIDIPVEEQYRFEHTHEAIIDQETFDIVTSIRGNKGRRNKVNEPNLLAGLLKCKDCGGNMVIHRQNNMPREKFNYVCGSYRKEGGKCTAHRINMVNLEQLILNDILRVTYFARTHSKEFCELISREKSANLQKEIKKLKVEIDKLQKRDIKLTELFKRLYEDSVSENIPKETYQILSSDYLKEQKEVKERIVESEIQLENLSVEVDNVTRFLEKARKFTDIKELTPELLRIFIEKVSIYQRDAKFKHNQPQQIDIYYRDLGLIDVAMPKDVNKAIGIS